MIVRLRRLPWWPHVHKFQRILLNPDSPDKPLVILFCGYCGERRPIESLNEGAAL